MFLSEMKAGMRCRVARVGGEGALRQHFLDMGVIPGVEMELVKLAPMGDPMEFRIHGYELTLRVADAARIEAEAIEEKPDTEGGSGARGSGAESSHPGLGEGGKYHVKEGEDPLPEDAVLSFALVGNQNSGKTTLFNQLTGSNQHVGNFPGVTVDRKDGVIRRHPNTVVTDLPGIYSMSPYSAEELITRGFVLDEKPKGIINIVDATNIERNMYLTIQLMELDVPMVLALNMMDEVTGNGGSIRINEMENLLGIPVVPISASRNEGISELIDHAIHVARYQESPGRQDFCDKDEDGGAVHRCIHAVMHLIRDHADEAGLPIRFAASKVIEGDPLITEALKLDDNEKEMIEHIALQMEEERGLDRAAAMADMRYDFITRVCAATVVRPGESKEHQRSRKIDRILTGRFTALPAFIVIMGLVFFLTFHVIGRAFQDLIEAGVTALSGTVDQAFRAVNVAEWLRSLVVNGIFGGVGTVLSFLPIIVILFLFLSLLEDSGYMARVAFVMDKILRKIGLSGRSIVPMLIGFGCTVPGVMASRTLPSERDRRMTILLTPFMSCSAKLPIYAFFSQAFFPRYAALVMIGLYVLDILVGIGVAAVYRKAAFSGEAVPFVMELPNYRMPGVKNVARLLWDKAKDFLQRAFTIIFLASIVIWFLQNFDFMLRFGGDPENSILARAAGLIAPVFSPVGFGDWRLTTSLITGFLAKESVVSTVRVLIGSGAALSSLLTPASALSLLTFSSLYTPCVAAVSSIRRELGRKWALAVILIQCVVAWAAAFLIYRIALLFG